MLWGLVLLGVIAASFTVTTRTEIALARNAVDNAKARALADAAVHRAVLALVQPTATRQLRADGTLYRFTFAGGEALISVEDEAGKIDLNRAPGSLLNGLFRAVGLDPDDSAALADAVLDFRDSNDSRRLNGAEDDDYRAAGRRFGAKDGPFRAVEELRQVLGVTPEIYALVAPALTVHSRRRSVNQETAPPLVQQALLARAEAGEGALDAEDEPVETVEDDEEGEAPEPEEIGAAAEELAPDDEGEGAARRARLRAVTVRAEARTAAGAVFVREAVVQFSPRLASKIHYRVWRQGSLAEARAVASD